MTVRLTAPTATTDTIVSVAEARDAVWRLISAIADAIDSNASHIRMTVRLNAPTVQPTRSSPSPKRPACLSRSAPSEQRRCNSPSSSALARFGRRHPVPVGTISRCNSPSSSAPVRPYGREAVPPGSSTALGVFTQLTVPSAATCSKFHQARGRALGGLDGRRRGLPAGRLFLGFWGTVG